MWIFIGSSFFGFWLVAAGSDALLWRRILQCPDGVKRLALAKHVSALGQINLPGNGVIGAKLLKCPL